MAEPWGKAWHKWHAKMVQEDAMREALDRLMGDCSARCREEAVTVLRAALAAQAAEIARLEALCAYDIERFQAFNVQVAALTEERDRLRGGRFSDRDYGALKSRVDDLTTAHAALRASITTGVTCTCRRYDYVGTRVCWRCAALAAAPGP